MVTLQDKFRGCIGASWIASAMGAAVEGWTREKIKETHGYVDRLLPYKHYVNVTDWQRVPGTTEDGIERQKLIATAIIEKQDRVLADDVYNIWVRDLDPDKVLYKQERFDRALAIMAKAGVPPAVLGSMTQFPGLISLPRGSHPIGLINAGDPQGAADDAFEIGKLYYPDNDPGMRWAALYDAAIAEACKPDATVESVIETARRFATYRAPASSLYKLYDIIERDIDFALDLAARHTDPMEMRDAFYEKYFGGNYMNYGIAYANEIVPKGLAIFIITRGDPKLAITTAVNFGRDTDCLAATAGGLAGALSGASALPSEWIEQVNAALASDPYTNNKRTVEETADGLLGAFQARRRKLEAYLQLMGDPAYIGAPALTPA